jgi:hypothetical protein
MILTSTAQSARKVEKAIKTQVNLTNILYLFFGLEAKLRNYVRVKNNIIGITVKFWKRIAVCTSLLRK